MHTRAGCLCQCLQSIEDFLAQAAGCTRSLADCLSRAARHTRSCSNICFLDSTCLPFTGCNQPLINSLASKLGYQEQAGCRIFSRVTALPGWHLMYDVLLHATRSTFIKATSPG